MELRFVGTIREGNSRYQIYYYNHINIHPAGIAHGIQKLIIIKDQKVYVGSYLIDDAPIGVSNADVLFLDGRVHFDLQGPPSNAVADGTELSLGR